MSDNWTQYRLVRSTDSGIELATCWIRTDRRLRAGQWISLVDIPGSWMIDQVYSGTTQKDKPKQGWHNNI